MTPKSEAGVEMKLKTCAFCGSIPNVIGNQKNGYEIYCVWISMQGNISHNSSVRSSIKKRAIQFWNIRSHKPNPEGG